MGVVSYFGMVGLVLVIGVAVPRIQPAVVEQMSREIGLDRGKGWILFAVAILWAFLPFLAGADVGEGKLWVAGSAVAGMGFYLVAIAASSRDEYRILNRTTKLDPAKVTPGSAGDVVATAGVPSKPSADAAKTPFSGVPAVHTDWLVQRRRRIGLRKTWSAVASGVENAPFTLGGGAVRVDSGRTRAFSDAELFRTVEPDEALPERAATFLRDHESLPDPADRGNTLRFMEQFVPADEPVTVVGTPRQGDEPGQVVVDDAPSDALLGTHADYTAGDGSETDVVLIRGDAHGAQARLRKRLYWLGFAGVAMILGGQLFAFWLSSATLGGML